MIGFFRRIRRQLISDHKTTKYFKYAFGEIVLVVLGILIALQVNNWNETRKDRNAEIVYLDNLKSDFEFNIKKMDTYLAERTASINSAHKMIDHFEGKPIVNLDSFLWDIIMVYDLRPFDQVDNTFKELMNTGKFSNLSDKTIKKKLLDIDDLYSNMKTLEEQYRHISYEALSFPSYEYLDLYYLESYLMQEADQKDANMEMKLRNQLNEVFKNKKIKNGCYAMIVGLRNMNYDMMNLKKESERFVELIENE